MMAASGLQRCMRASAGRRCLAHACALPSLPQHTAMNEHVAWRASLPALPWSAGQLVGRKHSSWALLGRNGTPLGADAQSTWVLRAKKGKKGKKGGRSASAAADDEDLDPEEALTAVLEGAETAMDKAVKWLTGEMAKLRGAGASPSAYCVPGVARVACRDHTLTQLSSDMLDHITVDAYGSPAELSTIAQVSVKGATMLQVSVFDPSVRSPISYRHGAFGSPHRMHTARPSRC